MKISIQKTGLTYDERLKYVVICVKAQKKWLFVRHKDRTTWELAGGHIETGETTHSAAIRELYEETGIKNVQLEAVCDYHVQNNDKSSLGRLYYAETDERGELPNFEIAEVRLFENLPENLTYTEIYKVLFTQINEYEKIRGNLTNVYFVRHAQPDISIKDDMLRPLTEKGLEDSKLVTEALNGKIIHVIYSSPYKRAFDTVKNLAGISLIEIKKHDGFRERKVDNVWVEDFKAFSQKQWEDFDYKLENGECLREVQERNISALKEVIKENLGKNIVIGSHGTALSTIINYFNPDFKYNGFWSIIDKMPYIICFRFNNMEFIGMEEIKL